MKINIVKAELASIDLKNNTACCWMEIPDWRIAVSVPLDSLKELNLSIGDNFLWDINNKIAIPQNEEDDVKIKQEMEQKREEMKQDLARLQQEFRILKQEEEFGSEKNMNKKMPLALAIKNRASRLIQDMAELWGVTPTKVLDILESELNNQKEDKAQEAAKAQAADEKIKAVKAYEKLVKRPAKKKANHKKWPREPRKKWAKKKVNPKPDFIPKSKPDFEPEPKKPTKKKWAKKKATRKKRKD